MTTLNRTALFSIYKNSANAVVSNTMLRSISGAQLALTGDFTEADMLDLVGLVAVPATVKKVEYERFKYAKKLVKSAMEARYVTDDIKTAILTVNLEDQASIDQFQSTMAIKGFYFTNASGFDAFIAECFTAEEKEKRAILLAEKQAKKAPVQTATATATDTVSTQAAVTNGNNEADSALVASALADAIENGDIIGQTLAKAKALPMAEAMLAMAEAWAADRAAMAAQLAELQAKYVMATAPKARAKKAA